MATKLSKCMRPRNRLPIVEACLFSKPVEFDGIKIRIVQVPLSPKGRGKNSSANNRAAASKIDIGLRNRPPLHVSILLVDYLRSVFTAFCKI